MSRTAFAPETFNGTTNPSFVATSRTYNSGELVAVVASYADNTGRTLAIANSGTAQSWTPGPVTNTASNCKLAMWFCVMSTTQAMTITVSSSGGSNTVNATGYVYQYAGQHATTPVPAGNRFSGTGGNDVTQSITPTSNGSYLEFVVGDWQQHNAITAAANCTKENGTDEAGAQTTGSIVPTVSPRTDTTAFTIGSASDATAETEAWIAFEVQMAAVGDSSTPMLNMVL